LSDFAFTLARRHNQLNIYQFNTPLSAASGPYILSRGDVQIRITNIPPQRFSVLALLRGQRRKRPVGITEVF
jgi:hypothetical protein